MFSTIVWLRVTFLGETNEDFEEDIRSHNLDSLKSQTLFYFGCLSSVSSGSLIFCATFLLIKIHYALEENASAAEILYCIFSELGF